MYIPPVSSSTIEEFIQAYEEVNEQLQEACTKFSTAELVMYGDFNLPGFKWRDNNNIVYAEGENSIKAVEQGVSALELGINQCGINQLLVFNRINSELEKIDWHTIISDNMDIDIATGKFYTYLFGIIAGNVPYTRTFVSTYPPWFDKSSRKGVKLKEKLHTEFIESMLECDYEEFSKRRAKSKRRINIAFAKCVKNIESDIQNKPKCF
ncbi:hypothetical protein QAD02_020303 [Eretmocerus hayati]|uniref:Uncharacterized protein n=1 Tax=Eretmocerus hayati TaxID=131215 RepID=A0ACC2PNB8_9HYME|nr:hypothetical protein QAD02_020303 [Eretmocerus hayati]